MLNFLKVENVGIRFKMLIVLFVPMICLSQECLDINGDCTLAGPVEFHYEVLVGCGDTVQLQPTQELCNSWIVGSNIDYQYGIGNDSMSIIFHANPCSQDTIIVEGITNTPSGTGVASCNTTIFYAIVPRIDTSQQELNCFEFAALESETEILLSSCGCDSLLVEYTNHPVVDTTYLVEQTCYEDELGVGMDTLVSSTGCDSLLIITTELFLYQEVFIEDQQGCIGETIVLDAIIDQDATYQWDTGATTSFLEVTEPGNYFVTITDENGCPSIGSALAIFNDIGVTLDVSVFGPLLIALDPLEVWQGAAIELQAEVFGTSFPYEIIWNGGPEIGDTTLNYIAVQSTELKVAAIDSLGCIGVETFDVIVRPIKAYVPSAFSPNGDGVNELLNVFTSPSVEEVRLQVFSRTGSLVFDKTLLAQQDRQGLVWSGWDGLFKGDSMHPQVFVYQLRYRGIRGEWESISGDVTLVR